MQARGFYGRTAPAAACAALLLTLITSHSALAALDEDQCEFLREKVERATAGTTILVPTGTFTCREPIVLNRDGITLRGTTRDASILRLADNANAPLVVIGNIESPPAPVRNVTVSDLTLDGNMEHQQIECWGGACGGGGKSEIRNNGISVRGAFDARVENVRAFHARSGGLVTERGTRRLIVKNFEAYDNFFDGLAGYDTEESEFTNLYLHDNHYAGISVDQHFSRNKFADALVTKNGDVGIYARYGEENQFLRLVVQENGSHGIYLAHDGGLDSCATRYRFDNTDVLNNKGFGLWFNDAVCPGTTFVNSRFYDNASGCHYVAEGGQVEFTNTACRK